MFTQASVYSREIVKRALDLVDICLLDDFIVAGNETMSFAEQGLL